ncbi:MAG TPA: amino acid adenylation domain-containing protein, partial [Pyrinomonadaceae bacterium]
MNSTKDSIEDIYPLSPMQQGILFHALLNVDTAVYVEQLTCAVSGPLDVGAFKSAWQRLIERHSILRTAFVWEGLREPMQYVVREASFGCVEDDWRGLPAAEGEERLRQYLRQDRARGMALNEAPLMRAALFRRAEQDYQFVWSYHHLLLDGWSGALLFQEALTLYKSLRRGETPRLDPVRPFGDYIEWLQRQPLSAAESFWRGALRGLSTPTPLWLDRAPTGGLDQASRHDRQETILPAALTRELTSLARRNQLTLNTMIQGAWALLLGRYSGQEDVMFGATVSGRPAALAGVETILGNFINTLPVRVQLNPDAVIIDWLKELQDAQAEARQYDYVTVAQIQGWSDVPRGMPLFESVVVFENYPTNSAFGAGAWEEEAELRLSEIRSDDLINFPLALGAEPGTASELTLRLVYDARRFDDAVVGDMLGHLRTTLEVFARDPFQPLKAVTLLTEVELRRLLFEWNDTRREYSPYTSVLELFDAQVGRAPDSVAVCFEGERLTYGELDARANMLARRLRRLGVGPETLVGLHMERSLEMVVSILGVLKAGGAYLPLDPSYPHERLDRMLEEARPPVVLTQDALAEQLPAASAHVLCVDSCWDSIAEEGGEPTGCTVSGGNVAYVIYTSGSTGKPKGVMNTHEAILNRLLWMQDAFGLTAADSVLQKTPFGFDVSVWEFLWPLMYGARLVVARPGGHQDSSYLVELIVEEKITVTHFVPSMLRIFLEEKGVEACERLRHVVCSGEALPAELVSRFYERCQAQLHNLYGPTEAAIDVTSWRCERGNDAQTVPIGRPISNTQIYLLDTDLRPVPVGVPGELHIGGVNLARGYLGWAELTAEKFIPDPFGPQPGARLYKTGDIARFRPEGQIEYLGRTDAQVKIRGFRIELGEIETTLSRHAQVREAVVLAREDTPGNKRLVAYLTLAPGAQVNITELRGFLQMSLPEYMAPAAFVFMESFPLTESGKIDRRRLPPPDEDRSRLTTPLVGPRTSAEAELATMWRELLGVERVGVHDNFFELGGHSLMLTQLASRIDGVFQVQLPLRVLFNVPTIVEMTTAIAARQMEQADPEELT